MKYQQHITQDEDGNFIGSLSNNKEVVYVTASCKTLNEVNAKINSYLSSTKRNNLFNSATEVRTANSLATNEKVPAPLEIKEIPLQRQLPARPPQKRTCCNRG